MCVCVYTLIYPHSYIFTYTLLKQYEYTLTHTYIMYKICNKGMQKSNRNERQP